MLMMMIFAVAQKGERNVSDLLIKKGKMPKDCPMCPMAHWNKLDELTGCEIVPGKRYAMTKDPGYADSSSRPDWCPLVEIPPHGDLIDRDEIAKQIQCLLEHPSDLVNGQWIKNTIRQIPTIIEAEVEHE